MHQPRRLRLSAPRSLAALTLLFCSSTLVCCALPAFLVLLGAGSVMATLLSWCPGLVVLSQQKTVVFGVAAAALLSAGHSLQNSARQPCSLDPHQARRCRNRLRQARLIYGLSCGAFLVGGSVAYVLPLLHLH